MKRRGLPKDVQIRNYLVIDVEATCNKNNNFPQEEREIIEIGAVLVDAETFELHREFQTFVRPVRHPILTDFCVELTGIAQKDVDKAPGYVEAMRMLRVEMKPQDRTVLFASWGAYDRHQFEYDCLFHGIEYPFNARHVNLKKRFNERLGYVRRYGMTCALDRCGLDLEGRHHSAIDDARNCARLLPWAVGGRHFSVTY